MCLACTEGKPHSVALCASLKAAAKSAALPDVFGACWLSHNCCRRDSPTSVMLHKSAEHVKHVRGMMRPQPAIRAPWQATIAVHWTGMRSRAESAPLLRYVTVSSDRYCVSISIHRRALAFIQEKGV